MQGQAHKVELSNKVKMMYFWNKRLAIHNVLSLDNTMLTADTQKKINR